MDFFFPGIETLERVRDQERRRSEKGRRERKVSDVKDREKGIFVTKLTFQKCFSFFDKCEFTCKFYLLFNSFLTGAVQHPLTGPFPPTIYSIRVMY